jgi:hypothetical protein
MQAVVDRGGIRMFLFLNTHFPPKNRFLWGTTQKTETFQKKQAMVCGQTKIASVALPPSQGDSTSTLMHPMAYMIAQHCSKFGRNAFVQTFLSLSGRSGQNDFA